VQHKAERMPNDNEKKRSALLQEAVLGHRLFVVVHPGGQIGVCVRINVPRKTHK
jgi:hypothetical protein